MFADNLHTAFRRLEVVPEERHIARFQSETMGTTEHEYLVSDFPFIDDLGTRLGYYVGRETILVDGSSITTGSITPVSDFPNGPQADSRGYFHMSFSRPGDFFCALTVTLRNATREDMETIHDRAAKLWDTSPEPELIEEVQTLSKSLGVEATIYQPETALKKIFPDVDPSDVEETFRDAIEPDSDNS